MRSETLDNMCTHIDKILTKDMLRQLTKSGTKVVTFYKVFRIIEGSKLVPVFQQETYDGDDSEGDGFLKAKKLFDVIDGDDIVGTGAYHGFSDASQAAEMMKYMESIYRRATRVREIEVPVDSIIGYSKDRYEVAFSKMKIRFEEGEHV